MTAEGAPLIADARRQLESLPIAVILIEPDCAIASVNPAAESFLGQSARRLRGQDLAKLLKMVDRHIARLFSDPETPLSARDILVRLGHERQRKVDMTVAPIAETPGWRLVTITEHGTFGAFGKTVSEPTDRLRGPEILAHEIKNPLAGIRGAAQLLSRKMSSEDAALTALITSEVDRIATLIEQMQLLSGKIVAPVDPCNLHQLIRQALAVLDLGKAQGPRSMPVFEDFDPSLPEVLGDANGLVQVLINLISNAQEACCDVEEPRIFIGTRFVSGLLAHRISGATPLPLPVELRISDNGPGVLPDLQETLFEPFATSKKDGQGLGLALVNKLVRDMNGRITFDRNEQEGITNFRVFLPLAERRREERQ